jgi:hypothetical protein
LLLSLQLPVIIAQRLLLQLVLLLVLLELRQLLLLLRDGLVGGRQLLLLRRPALLQVQFRHESGDVLSAAVPITITTVLLLLHEGQSSR